MLIRCKTVVTLQGIDALHLVGSQFEVEDVVVLSDMGSVGRTWNRDGTALQMPTEQNLIGRLVVSLGDAGDDLMLRERLNACATTTQREPCFEDGTHLGDMGLHAAALVIWMCFVLQHSWFDGGNLHHAVNVVLIEI